MKGTFLKMASTTAAHTATTRMTTMGAAIFAALEGEDWLGTEPKKSVESSGSYTMAFHCPNVEEPTCPVHRGMFIGKLTGTDSPGNE